MAKSIGKDASAIFDGIEAWKERCLLGEGSVFSEEPVWTLAHLDELVSGYVKNPLEGKERFFEKLKTQLGVVSVGAKRLTAEMYWVMLLFPSNITAEKKRADIRAIWALAQSEPGRALDHPALVGPIDVGGVGSCGPGYNNHRWAELAYFITLARAWKALDRGELSRVISDPWLFASFLDAHDAKGTRQLRHILAYLVFPDHFERMATGRHKLKARSAFASRAGQAISQEFAADDSPRVRLDKELLAIRRALESEYPGEPLDFYRAPLATQWRWEEEEEPEAPEVGEGGGAPSSVQGVTRTATRIWVEKCLVRGRADREAGEHALGNALWSPQRSTDGRDIYAAMRAVQPGDLVIHLVDNERVSGVSRVAAPVDTSFVGLDGTDWAGRPGYRVPLRDYAALEPPLMRTDFLSRPEYRDQLQTLLSSGESLFFNAKFELNQGAYLTLAPNELVTVLDDSYFSRTGKHLPYVPHKGTLQVEVREPVASYSIEDAKEDLFFDEGEIASLCDLWGMKKNLVLQGPPGVGKSFVGRRLAYALVGAKDDTRVTLIQFHQSFSYEDFIQGYRPSEDGRFYLRDGIFLDFCSEARKDPTRPYVLIIDEINRGNLSKIFGEVMLLIEADKRTRDWGVRLSYAKKSAELFFVPPNVYLLGLMNTADRSLALVDYALRRRFAFVHLGPAFQHKRFAEHLKNRGASDELIAAIQARLEWLNKEIREDKDLGRGFEVGHSYFANPESTPNRAWYERVIRTEIEPLVREYWFDKPESYVKDAVARLLAGMPD
jgi:MoxR-like ATPase